MVAALMLELAGKQLDLVDIGIFEGRRRWSGVMNPPIDNMNLDFLGAGMNKMAFQVRNTPWVLCFGHNLMVSRATARNDFIEEINTLVRLGTNGVPVPRPFPASPPSPNFLFSIRCTKESGEDFNEAEVDAFIMEHLPASQYAEMPKSVNEKLNFAKTQIIPGNRVPTTIGRTKADLLAICTEWRQRPWGDFQVMYHRATGSLTVFDPQATDGKHDEHRNAMNRWVADIDAAIAMRDAMRLVNTNASASPGTRLLEGILRPK